MKLSNDNKDITTKRLKALLFVWVVAACAIPNIWLSLTERMSAMQSITNIVLPCGIYLLLMSLSRKIGKVSLWMITLFFFAAFQIVLLYMYGRSVIAVDMFLNVVTTNPGEVGELLGNLMVIIIAVIAIYIPPIALGVIATIRRWRLSHETISRTRRASLWITGAGLICFGLSFSGARTYKPLCDLYPLNAIYNLYLAVERTVKVANYHKTSASFKYEATSEHPDSVPEIYVVMVGETSRADNWQINGYYRPTTPRLVGRKGLTSFSRAISQSNTTHKSVPMLLSPLDASNFGDSIYNIKSLITAFKEAGYATTFVSAHSRNHSFIDFFGEEADTCIFIKEQGLNKGHYYDTDLLPYLDEAIANGKTKQLIVLHCYGSHFNYIDRYPETEAVFRPDRPAMATHHYRDKQINAYDNTILFTSNMIADVIERLDRQGKMAGLIYTSDHGEDIFDDDRHLFLHASPIPSYYQIHVPMLVWLSDSYISQYPAKQESLNRNKEKYAASSRIFFHSIMDMAGIRTPWKKTQWSVLDSGYNPGPAIYLNDHNEAVELKDCGILDYDFKEFDALGIKLQ